MDIFTPVKNSKMGIGEVYYWTSTIYQWKYLLKPDKYKQLITEAFLILYGYVIMPNHIHLLWEIVGMNGKEMPHASFHKFTSHYIQKDLRVSHQEVLGRFYVNEKEREYRFWQRDPSVRVMINKWQNKSWNMHLNPLQSHWDLAARPEDYYYSSASFLNGMIKTLSF